MYKIEIRKIKTREVVKIMSCDSYKQAEKVERGANINLNHDEYYTQICTK